MQLGESRLQRSAVAVGRFLSQHATRVGLFVLGLLVLFGSVPGGRLSLFLVLIAAARSALIAAEGLRRRWTESDWQALHESAVSRLRQLDPEDLAFEADEHGLDPATRPEEIARALIAARRDRHRDPRPTRELFGEWVGLLSFALLVPLAFVLYTRDIVSLRSSDGALASGVALLCLALYVWPHRWAAGEGFGERRTLWWVLPAAALTLVYTGVTVHHPYLDPRAEDRVRLAAERVLALENDVVAGAHADWVFAYAEQAAARGDVERAVALYRRGLHLAPRAAHARRSLAALERRLDPSRGDAAPTGRDPRPRAHGLSAEAFAHLPFWERDRPIVAAPSCRIDAQLESVPGTTVVVVAIGPEGRR